MIYERLRHAAKPYIRLRRKLYLAQIAAIGDDGKRIARAASNLVEGETGGEVGRAIEAERQLMLQSGDVLDDGTLGAPGPHDNGVTIKAACEVSKRQQPALFLHWLAREFQPNRVLELGTNVGISAAYQAAALQRGEVWTVEASPYRQRLARLLHEKVGLRNVIYRSGLFDDALPGVLHEMQSVDYAFIDGNHQCQPTLDYFDTILKYASEGALFVFDDIRWSAGMKEAWTKIQRHSRVALAADFCSVGVCITRQKPSNHTHVTRPFRLF